MKVEERCKELGIDIPVAPSPVANYVPCRQTGNLVYISGQSTYKDGEWIYKGRLGESISDEDAYQAARLTGINLIAQLKAYLGDLDRIKQFVKINGYINCTDDYKTQPAILNGCSDLLVEVFGDAGKHARTALGINVLPMDLSVEIEAIVEVSD